MESGSMACATAELRLRYPAADGRRGAYLRAYNKATGADAGKVYIPAPQSGSPMTYMVGSKLGGVVPNGTIDAGAPGTYCVECWFVKK